MERFSVFCAEENNALVRAVDPAGLPPTYVPVAAFLPQILATAAEQHLVHDLADHPRDVDARVTQTRLLRARTLIPAQAFLNTTQIDHFRQTRDTSPILVYEAGLDRYIIVDGHHRAAAAALRDHPVLARIIQSLALPPPQE